MIQEEAVIDNGTQSKFESNFVSRSSVSVLYRFGVL